MKEAKPAEIIPAHGMPLPSGGIAVPSSNPNQVQEWTFYGASMEGLRAFLALPVQKPVEERTGPTKKYDFVLKKGDNEAPATGQEGPPASDPDLVNLWELGALGLELKPVKVKSDQMVLHRPVETAGDFGNFTF
jgi:uncharacterized protein (TIGR03435 family)